MRKVFSIALLSLAVFCTDQLAAQDGGKKDKKKKKEKKEAVDTTSAGTPAEITIDEPGSTRGKGNTNSNQRTDSTNTNGGVPAGVERPQSPAPPPPPAPAPEAAKAAPEDMEEVPAGAGGLQDNSGGSITIDEAGSQQVKKPADAIGGAVSPTNLTIDEAGTQKKKEVKTSSNLENENGRTDSTATQDAAPAETGVKEQVKEEVKEAAKEKAKEEGKEAGRRALDALIPKH